MTMTLHGTPLLVSITIFPTSLLLYDLLFEYTCIVYIGKSEPALMHTVFISPFVPLTTIHMPIARLKVVANLHLPPQEAYPPFYTLWQSLTPPSRHKLQMH